MVRLLKIRVGISSICIHITGVQPVLDAVIDYLPSPIERPPAEAFDEDGNELEIRPDPNGKLCALAFKVIVIHCPLNYNQVVHDDKKGMLTYIRVYSGKIKPAEKLINSSIKEAERPMKLFRVLADDMEIQSEVHVDLSCYAHNAEGIHWRHCCCYWS